MRDCSFCDEATAWAELLSDGRILCPACRPCIFFEGHLTLTGDYAGRQFLLMPWMRKVLREIFGTLDEKGLRQYRSTRFGLGSDIFLSTPPTYMQKSIWR